MSREGGEVIVADAVKFVPSALKMMTGHEMAAAEEIRIDNHLGRGTLSSFSRLELKSRCDNVHMAWIETIPESEAQGDLRLSYEAAVKRAGRVWNIIKVMSVTPLTLRAAMELYLASVHGPSPLTRAQREMLAVVVSKVNNCHY